MMHLALEQILKRAERDKNDSDFAFFSTLLYAGEALIKTIVSGYLAALVDDDDRNRYRLEHNLVHADGIGSWVEVLDDALAGTASQLLVVDAQPEQRELMTKTKKGEWQYDAVVLLNEAIQLLGMGDGSLPDKTDLRKWFHLFSHMRNKTRGHGAVKAHITGKPALKIQESLLLIIKNSTMLNRPWVHLYRNLSGKYRISTIAGSPSPVDSFLKNNSFMDSNGIFILYDVLRSVPLMETEADLNDFYFANGGVGKKKYELISYSSDNKKEGDLSKYHLPPGQLPSSETEGKGSLVVEGNCLTNIPEMISDYIERPELEEEIERLLLDDRMPIITLVGRGGIGKTSLAIKVIKRILHKDRYENVIWFSARDVDLQISGPKAVRAFVKSQESISEFYSTLVDRRDALKKKQAAVEYFQKELQTGYNGKTLFVFDNFETTTNPIEIYSWIYTYIRLPNKILITTRLRDFNGDHRVEISGMNESESILLIDNTAINLKILNLLTNNIREDIIKESEGHPYIIKIMLGQFAAEKGEKSLKRIFARSDDILTALFERTYASLSPCAQRAFLTLSSWKSLVPRLALEAVLYHSTNERSAVEEGIESLIQYSMAELYSLNKEEDEFIGLPLVASIFGHEKLQISPMRLSIQNDVEILMLMGASTRTDVSLLLEKKIKTFIRNISEKINAGEPSEKYYSILEVICRAYPQGWLLLARWHMEQYSEAGFNSAIVELKNFLQKSINSSYSGEAWKLLAEACKAINDNKGYIHALIEMSQFNSVDFMEISNAANIFNRLIAEGSVSFEPFEKKSFAIRLLDALENRKTEADADSFSRMAWLAINADQEHIAREYIKSGLTLDPYHYHCRKIAEKFHFFT